MNQENTFKEQVSEYLYSKGLATGTDTVEHVNVYSTGKVEIRLNTGRVVVLKLVAL